MTISTSSPFRRIGFWLAAAAIIVSSAAGVATPAKPVNAASQSWSTPCFFTLFVALVHLNPHVSQGSTSTGGTNYCDRAQGNVLADLFGSPYIGYGPCVAGASSGATSVAQMYGNPIYVMGTVNPRSVPGSCWHTTKFVYA